jgi:molecular chaperone DnaK
MSGNIQFSMTLRCFGCRIVKVRKNQDIAGIDAATAELNTVFQAASEEMYRAGAQQQQEQGQQSGGSNNTDEVTDVDFEEVK